MPHKDNKQLYEMASHFGVDADDFQEEDTGSQGHFDREGFADAIEDAMANDYDIRRATEAAHLSGEYHDEDGKLKDGAPPRSIGSIEDGWNALQWFKDQHEGGGQFSSNQDFANITEKWVGKDRDNLLAKIGAASEEEDTTTDDENTKPKERRIPLNVAQSMAHIDVYNSGLQDGSSADVLAGNMTRGQYAQLTKDKYVNRVKEYANPFLEGSEPWNKHNGGDDQQDMGAVMPYTAPGIMGGIGSVELHPTIYKKRSDDDD